MERKNGWYLLYVQFRHEKKVYQELEEKGIDSFLPMTTTVRKWSDRIKKVEMPLFPSYLFVNIKSDKDFHSALTIETPCSYVSFGNEYGRVSQMEIDQIKLLLQGKNITDIEVTRELPAIGDKLKIIQGELSGLECEVYKADNLQKIRVRLSSLRQNISATIPLSYLSQDNIGTVAC
jgi:transcriptional antiterminator RfaH